MAIITINNGTVNVYFEQKGKNCYITYGDGAVPMPTTVKKGNDYYKSLRIEGFVVGAMPVASPKPPKEAKGKRAKSPKATSRRRSVSKSRWDFGAKGFDRNLYIRTADQLGLLFCLGSDRCGRPIFKVAKNNREKVYEAMGAKKVVR